MNQSGPLVQVLCVVLKRPVSISVYASLGITLSAVLTFACFNYR